MTFIFVFLNYFWLSKDPAENASWYCDQHCFKIHSEVISSVWDAVLELAPWIEKLADEEGISMAYRTRRHAKPGPTFRRWHPLSAWNALCYENCLTSMICARALLLEHRKRTSCKHKVWKDWKFLWKHIHEVSFSPHPGGAWDTWKQKQFPDMTIEKLLKPFAPIPVRDFDLDDDTIPIEGLQPQLSWWTGQMTEPPRCINTKMEAFEECVSVKPGFDGLIEAYRKYYEAKTQTIAGGMRYYYTQPPGWMEWLTDKLKCKRGGVNSQRE